MSTPAAYLHLFSVEMAITIPDNTPTSWQPRAFFVNKDDAVNACVNWGSHIGMTARVLNPVGGQVRRDWKSADGQAWYENELGEQVCLGYPVLV